MPACVCTGALVKCAMGVAPSPMTALPTSGVTAMTPAANIGESKPMANIKPFGMCMSMANPQVAAATAAALGVLQPQPCIPVIVAPWVPGAVKTKMRGLPALSQTSMAMCMWAGVIQVLFPGQVKFQTT